ncbi:carbonic anhydrase [Chthoniobacter flavus Ellin428]|uniref:Carbonic anhydrase n=1 Tax=Chthoniobacter flavus Ellin428 TaxID=497964 RepID=B4D5B3_9BACT|nr:carbonic anhydrase [Chthoniobacter flavus]EDY18318.1 carbonic anhydrase [Chthoniobacter flavus Ellin428]TCO91344.1 carbonic anhydrase [Chthoniobacter flavus]
MKIPSRISAVLLSLLLPALAAAADHTSPSVGADVALARLKAGNQRFASASVSSSKPVAARRAATVNGQHPFAIIVGCADSRTPPEIIFDQSIGDLFVVRAAGNLVDDYGLGSIEYAVEHLGARLIVVLGHQKCGAVQAALSGGEAPGHIHALVSAIQPAVQATKGKPGDPLSNAVHENDALVAEKIRKKARLGDLTSQVRVVEGCYDLRTGKVEWAK